MENFMGKPADFETLYSLLYTIPAIPNIILPFFGGYFVDTLGAPKCMIVFISLIASGHAIFAFGLSIKSWTVMFIGRAIFGIGETSNSICTSTYAMALTAASVFVEPKTLHSFLKTIS
jgi:MFS family permease